MTIYDYLTNPMGRPVLSGQWCSHRSFNQVRGGTLQGELGARPDNPAAPFSGRLPLLRQACQALGGTPAEGGDFSCILPVLEGFPILLRFWDADEEFAAQLQLMWDRYTTRYLRYETTFYTAGAVYDRLHRLAGLSPSAR